MFCWFYEDHYCYYNFKIIPDKRDIINGLHRLTYYLEFFIWQCDLFITFGNWINFTKINILFCISWLLGTQNSGRENYSISLYSGKKSSTQPPTLFWDRNDFHFISFSIQKKLVFNQKLVNKKTKCLWEKWPILN